MQILKLATAYTGPTLHRYASVPQLDQVDLGSDAAADILFGTTQNKLAAEALSMAARKKLGHVPKEKERLWNLASGKSVALSTDFRTVTATDLNTGEKLWTHQEFPDSFGGLRPLRPDKQGKFVALTDAHHRVALLDGETGRVGAEIEPPVKGFTTVSEFTQKGQLVVGVSPSLPSGSKAVTYLYGYDPKRPEEPLWTVELEKGGLGETAESPDGNFLYVTARNDYTVHAIDLRSGELAWSKKQDYVSDPVVAGDGTVIIRGVGYDPQTRLPRWKVPGNHVSVPTKDEDQNLYFSTDGDLHVRTPEGEPKWERADAGRSFMHPPVVTDHAVYAISVARRGYSSREPQQAKIHILDRETGKDLAVSEPMTEEVSRGFFRAGDRVLLGVNNGYVSMELNDTSYRQLTERVAREKEALSIDIGEDFVSVGDFDLEIMDY